MNNKKSPLKDKPLRQAGQSVQERINNILDDKVMPYLIIPLILIMLAGLEWFRYFHPSKPQPITATVIAIISLIYCVLKIIIIRKELLNLRQGRDGEKAVAEELEKLRESGAIVFHDIVGDNFNLDHVVLSQKGIYAVETKTYSKPNNRRAEIKINGDSIVVDGQIPERDAIAQAKAASAWLYKVLNQSTGKKFFVCPVVLFPGWFVHEENHPDFMLLNPERFPKALERKSNVLDESDIKLAAFHLSRYIRAT